MKVTYRRAARTVLVRRRDTILATSIRNKIPHLHECGGLAHCTTCRVRIVDGLCNVSERTDPEANLAQQRGWDDNTRLACQARINGDITVERVLETGADIGSLAPEAIKYGSGKVRMLGLLFCDMRNFTAFVESHLPHDVVHIMNRFFTALGEPILLNNGMIYQYVGDEIIGLFGIGDDNPTRVCQSGVRAGLGMLRALEHLNVELTRDFNTELHVGIGLHYGRVIVGQMGHPSVEKFAVVGDAINVASRIQSTTRTLDVDFLVSDQVLEHLPEGTLKTGLRSEVELKGKNATSTVVEVTGLSLPDHQHIVQGMLSDFRRPGSAFGTTFYRILFSLFPETRPMFPEDMAEQEKLMLHMVEAIAYAAGRPQNLALGLTELGRRHRNYGVKHEHYPVVRLVLESTAKELMGERYTKEVATAWMAFLDTVLQLMASTSDS